MEILYCVYGEKAGWKGLRIMDEKPVSRRGAEDAKGVMTSPANKWMPGKRSEREFNFISFFDLFKIYDLVFKGIRENVLRLVRLKMILTARGSKRKNKKRPAGFPAGRQAIAITND